MATEKPKAKKVTIIKKEFSELARIREDYTKEQKEYILKTLAPTLNENELLLFLYRAKKLGLNPLHGEITAHSRQTKYGRKMVIVIGKDGKARKAMQTGLVEWVKSDAIYSKQVPGDEKNKSTFVRCEPWEGGTLWGAIAEVKRKNVKKTFGVTIPLSEYKTGQLYGDMPDTMIKKTALSQCYTLAFPDLFAGVYVEEELPTIMKESSVEPLAVAGGEEDASEIQLATIKSMGGKIEGKITKQEAANMIRELSQKKKK